MDAFELLKTDHKNVAELFDRLESARGKAKLDVFKQIKAELDLHVHVEETIFYPAIEKPEETHDLTLEAFEEHKVIKTLLAELAGARSANDEWQAKAKVLRENVEHHVDEEENELFDKADNALSSEQIEELGAQMEAEKARKQGRPAPKQPNAKASRSSKASASKAGSSKASAGKSNAREPGILSKLASFVGLGSKPTSEKAAKKAPKKKAATKKSSKASATTAPAKKKTVAKKSSKASAKPASRKAGGKSSIASASKRASTAPALKRVPRTRPSASKKSRRGRKAK